MPPTNGIIDRHEDGWMWMDELMLLLSRPDQREEPVAGLADQV